MKKLSSSPLLLVLVVGLCAPAALARRWQCEGVAKDAEGKVITGPKSSGSDRDGRKYELKTNKQGRVLLVVSLRARQRQAAEDGKEICTLTRQRRRSTKW